MVKNKKLKLVDLKNHNKKNNRYFVHHQDETQNQEKDSLFHKKGSKVFGD